MKTDAVAGAAVHQQILSLNALRGLSALIVVFSHLPMVSELRFGTEHQGSLGVMVFFTLSGFLMGMLYLGQPATPRNVARYAVARFSRIAPPYLIVVLVSFLVFTLVDPKFPYAIGTHNLLRHLLFSGNVSVLWSIPPEVQFYVLFIGLWWAVYRASLGQTGPLLGVLALALLVICLRSEVPGTVVVSKLHYFLMGSLLGWLYPRLRGLPVDRAVLTVLQLGLLGAFLLFFTGVTELRKDHWADLAPALFCGLAVYAFSLDRTVIDRVLAARPFQKLGDWSFSIYLVHAPALYLLNEAGLLKPGLIGTLSVALAVGAAVAFSVCIEHPACAFTKRRLTALLQRLPGPRPNPLLATDRSPR
jgi:peptidoglycan/LPS O-acetylase OafA/YrhL